MISSMEVIAVIPAYRSSKTIVDVVKVALKWVDLIIVVDDACPEKTGDFVKSLDRVVLITRPVNGGVGAATKDGIEKALEFGPSVILKLDSDGQMDPNLIPTLVDPILKEKADYAKGTRFDSPEDLEGMPAVRLIGNAILSLITKFSSGYWTVNDPTNGFVAMSREIADNLSWGKIDNRYFFESDLLFRIRLLGARVAQFAMRSNYGTETSSLRPFRVVVPFMWKHVRNQVKRHVYMYFVKEWNQGTIYLVASFAALITGVSAGIHAFFQSQLGPVGTGTSVLASIGFILWVQLIAQFFTVEANSEPRAV